jgi:precorrin-6B methylase 2
VTVIGGGRGIVAVAAARETGVDGNVTVIEAAKEQCERTRETVAYNLFGNVSVKHAIVGSAVDVWGETAGADILTPDDLDGDVWIVDIEGGETQLVSQLTAENKPETCIIETHTDAGVSVSALRKTLRSLYPSVSVLLVTPSTTAMGGPVLVAREE